MRGYKHCFAALFAQLENENESTEVGLEESQKRTCFLIASSRVEEGQIRAGSEPRPPVHYHRKTMAESQCPS